METKPAPVQPPEKMNLPKELFKMIVFIHLGLFAFILIVCLLYTLFNPPFSTLQIYRKYVYKYDVKPVKFVPLKRIPPAVKLMVLEVEDGNFYKHIGIEFDSIKEAIILNQKYHRKFYGGSTITQQLARTLFLIPEKTFFRKYLEAWIALEMNFILSKDRVLELYLNNIEWGKGIFGIEQASRSYFSKSVWDLSKEEMIRLVTVLPSPVKYNPDNFDQLRIMRERYNTLESLMGFHPNASDTSVSNVTLLPVITDTNGTVMESSLNTTNQITADGAEAVSNPAEIN